jgi:hypothetical protein
VKIKRKNLRKIIKEVITESRMNIKESDWIRKEDYRGEVTLTKEWTKEGETLVKFYIKETDGSSYYGYGPGFSISAYTSLDTGLYQGHLWYWSTTGNVFQEDGPRKQYIHESEQVAMREAEKFIKYMKATVPKAFMQTGPKEDMTGHDWVHDGYV